MKAFINRHLFTQTSLDSGSLTMLGAVIHNFPEPGEYIGTILWKEEAVGNFRLTVDEKCPDMQVNIDLPTLHRPISEECKSELMKHFIVNPTGYVLFHASHGAGGYAVRVGRLSEERKEKLFESRELKAGDLFAATLIRPGTYSITNVITRARGEIVVAYPKIGEVPYRPPKPVSIECTEKEFEPDKIKIEAAQGQVYRIRMPSRIRIELVKPDDGPEGARQPRIVGRRKSPTR